MTVYLIEPCGGRPMSKVIIAIFDQILDPNIIGYYFDGVGMPALIEHSFRLMDRGVTVLH